MENPSVWSTQLAGMHGRWQVVDRFAASQPRTISASVWLDAPGLKNVRDRKDVHRRLHRAERRCKHTFSTVTHMGSLHELHFGHVVERNHLLGAVPRMVIKLCRLLVAFVVGAAGLLAAQRARAKHGSLRREQQSGRVPRTASLLDMVWLLTWDVGTVSPAVLVDQRAVERLEAHHWYSRLRPSHPRGGIRLHSLVSRWTHQYLRGALQ